MIQSSVISKTLTCIILFVITGCTFIKKPPIKEIPDSIPNIETSRISIPIIVDIEKIEKAILESIENPIANGKTDELDIKILATKKITERQLIKKLLEPAKPGYYVTKYKNVEKKVSKAFKCMLKPWKWGKCYKDVIEVVKVPYDMWIEPVEAVYGYVSEDITKLIDKTFDISGWLNYKANVQSFDMDINGNVLNSSTKLKIDLSLDYKQNAFPFGPDIQINGALTCTIEAEIKINGTINIGENADLLINLPDNGGEINFTKICLPEAIEVFDIVSLMSPILMITKDQIGKKLDQKLTEKIIEEINDKQGDLNFKDEVIKNATAASKPNLIGENVWLLPNVKSLEYTDINGENGKLKFQLALECTPEIFYSKEEFKITPNNAPVVLRKVNSINPNTQLLIDASISYEEAEHLLNTEIADFQNSKYPKNPYYLANSHLYPSNEKIVISLDLIKKKNNKRKLRLYAWGIPKYNAESSEVYLDSLQFTLQSKSAILKFLTAIFEKEIIEKLAKTSIWSISNEKQKILQEISDINYVNEDFIISGGFNRLDLIEVFTTKDKFKVFVKTTGQIIMEIDPLGSQKIVSDMKEISKMESLSNLRFVADDHSSTNYVSESFNTMSTFANSMEIEYLPKEETIKSIESSFFEDLLIMTGDTIYLDEKFENYRIAEDKDASSAGDTLYFINHNNELLFHVLSFEDLNNQRKQSEPK